MKEEKSYLNLNKSLKQGPNNYELNYYLVPYQLEQSTGRRFNMERGVVHTEAYTTNQVLRTTLV